LEAGKTNEGGLLSLILVDSELEIVPREYWSHPAVVVNARKRKKKPSRVLLDTNLHHSIFKDPAERNRRGRPDIVHQFLLIGLESMLNIDGGLKLYVHTRNDELITISPMTRLPKNYNRYFGLFEELFNSGAVPPGGDPLITLRQGMGLPEVLESVKENGPKGYREVAITLDSSGDRSNAYDSFGSLGKGPFHVICMIGGFPSGSYRSDPGTLSDFTMSFHEDELKAWSVEMEIISAFYNAVFRGNRTSGGA
jgi:rRNA small subunit pseudouridine methyltransferase Nep1